MYDRGGRRVSYFTMVLYVLQHFMGLVNLFCNGIDIQSGLILQHHIAIYSSCSNLHILYVRFSDMHAHKQQLAKILWGLKHVNISTKVMKICNTSPKWKVGNSPSLSIILLKLPILSDVLSTGFTRYACTQA